MLLGGNQSPKQSPQVTISPLRLFLSLIISNRGTTERFIIRVANFEARKIERNCTCQKWAIGRNGRRSTKQVKREEQGRENSQQSRLQSIHIALKIAGEKAKGSVLASDAFMPFPDNVELAVQVLSIIYYLPNQPTYAH